MDENEFSGWLRQRWEEKDELMDAFYRDGRFPGQVTAVGPASLPVKGSNYAPLVATWLGIWPSWNFARAFVGALFRI
ncbi:MAG: hypothetical protein BJ554DRAFT_5050 [Olpidium bornovanus]|uniref:Acyltransferase C-terminal domain-containing protein n=1 Tax=Olpidium bornovanus TaxID=278681 RepID=A0A8H8DE95_9FUNG|nr:MAG: hypothetical protein BJ554DRAFT_5050 [Olpidium bornovanus]